MSKKTPKGWQGSVTRGDETSKNQHKECGTNRTFLSIGTKIQFRDPIKTNYKGSQMQAFANDIV